MPLFIFILFFLISPIAVFAQEEKSTEVNGYASNRLTGSLINVNTLIPIKDTPAFLNMIEGNVQLKRTLFKNAFFYTDASALIQFGGVFFERGSQGQRQLIDAHDATQIRPQFALSEAYFSYSPSPYFNLTVGKKRVVWGPGFANNPTDIINPGKDPSDPGLQRTGAFLVRAEVPLEHMTFSLLFSPQVLYQEHGLPYAIMHYPNYPSKNTLLAPNLYPDQRDKDWHYLIAARLYLLIKEADINLMYYFSNLYQDGFKNKSRIGLTFSRYFFTDYEFHAELLLQSGSSKNYFNTKCLNDLFAIAQCQAQNTPIMGPFKLEKIDFYPRLLVGARRVFSDESQLSLEYYYVGDGYDHTQFQAFSQTLAFEKQKSNNFNSSFFYNTNNQNSSLVSRFSFDPLRRHYLFLSYSKPKIDDDFTISAQLITGLEDLSGIIIPSVSWNAREWLTLQLNAFVPFYGILLNTAQVNEKSYWEYGLTPFDWRITLDIKAYY